MADTLSDKNAESRHGSVSNTQTHHTSNTLDPNMQRMVDSFNGLPIASSIKDAFSNRKAENQHDSASNAQVHNPLDALKNDPNLQRLADSYRDFTSYERSPTHPGLQGLSYLGGAAADADAIRSAEHECLGNIVAGMGDAVKVLTDIAAHQIDIDNPGVAPSTPCLANMRRNGKNI